MKNYEKYKDLVIECVGQNTICRLANVAYGITNCDERTCKVCAIFTAEWLRCEYVDIEWSKVEVDTPVIIKTKDGLMFRHFAEYYNGHVFVYPSGQTSWTNDGEIQPWDPEYVEIAKNTDCVKYAKQ